MKKPAACPRVRRPARPKAFVVKRYSYWGDEPFVYPRVHGSRRDAQKDVRGLRAEDREIARNEGITDSLQDAIIVIDAVEHFRRLPGEVRSQVREKLGWASPKDLRLGMLARLFGAKNISEELFEERLVPMIDHEDSQTEASF
mmetsp:Transcript_16583/g.35022  ORF Transcript_16583/g.35022 Transcript_16583/m.35022 type:complete len:143 (+) Transcript_16583:131-559(+)